LIGNFNGHNTPITYKSTLTSNKPILLRLLDMSTSKRIDG
jgi:hypothetical protein